MNPIGSTAEILLFKMMGSDVDKRWVDWAYNMLCAGFYTDELAVLAGETVPYNQFELKVLTDKLFADLHFDYSDQTMIFTNYIDYLLVKYLNGEVKTEEMLRKFKDLYLVGYDALFHDFYLLYHAYTDLKYDDHQWYWEDATKDNVDELVKNYCVEWLSKNKN